MKYYNVKEAPFRVYGQAPERFPERFIRLPEDAAKATSEDVARFSQYTSGIRVRFATDSDVLGIRVVSSELYSWGVMTNYATAGFDLYEYTENGGTFIGVFHPGGSNETEMFKSPYTGELLVPNDGKKRYFQINFPLYSRVDELYVGVRENATVEEGLAYRDIKPLIWYGSSITQGASASRPGNCHTAIVSRRLGMDYRNLGFSGSCKAETAIVEYLATLDPSVYIIEYDHNSSLEKFKVRHAPLAFRLRETHPETPMILVTRPDYYFTEEDAERRRTVINTYEDLLKRGDRNVYFVDGSKFFDTEERFEYTVDGVHPTDIGCFLMANALTPLIKKILKI